MYIIMYNKVFLPFHKNPLLDDLPSQLAFCIGNIIHDLVMGRHYEYNDEAREEAFNTYIMTLDSVKCQKNIQLSLPFSY